ncbi:MAG: hypothetical protein ACJ76N_22135 [Thermoanaerobaculia bacterium]
MKGSAVVLWGVAVAVALSPPGSAQQSCPFTAGGAVLVSDPAQVGALVPSGVPDTCQVTAPCVAQGSQPVHYDLYNLVNNNTAAPTCVTAKLTAACGVQGVTELYLAAYSPTFNPSSICQGYLGSSGMTAINSQVSASFQVPAGAPFQVVVSLPTGGQCEYTLNVTGCGAGDPQPIPALSPEGLVALLLGLAACGWWRLRRVLNIR